jgi:hypothetical protein
MRKPFVTKSILLALTSAKIPSASLWATLNMTSV